ncbi:MAG TPA: hypothetical protein VN257_07470 [Actinotalea sp.]|nr:hypothetical protein [Actinotalea sp.]
MTVLGSEPEVARPSYREGQFLSASDFVAEQTYHRRALGRHQVGGHTWGLVVGLDLVEVPDPGGSGFVDVFLTPGMAVDGFGRQIASFTRLPVDVALFDAFLDQAHRTVWIEARFLDASPAPDGFADCRDGYPTRTVESFRLVVEPVDPTTDLIVDGLVALAEPAAGATIPADTSVPHAEPPDETTARWLVRLGSVRWDGGARRFRPAGDRLVEGRRFVGLVGAEVLAPAGTLRVARRSPHPDPDADDFAGVEGRLRVQGRINAEKELWMEGDPIRFTYDGGGATTDPLLTLGRDHGPAGGKDRLRLTLGSASTPDVTFSIGTTADASLADPVAEIRADGRARIPLGPLDLGTVHREKIELHTASSGIGTQPDVVYTRSPSQFAWFTGGAHSDTTLDPGSGGTLRLKLDADGCLDFGTRTHQMLKLWNNGSVTYGVGIQDWTMYFRTDADFCWFRDGTHDNARGSAGAGGTVAMKLDDAGTLSVFGQTKVSSTLTVGAGGNAALVSRHVNGKMGGSDALDHLYLNWGTGKDVVVGGNGVNSTLDVHGGLRVRAVGQSAVDSVIKVVTTDLIVQNAFDGTRGTPANWSWNWGNQLDEVYAVYASITSFGLMNTAFPTNPTRATSTSSIPQYVWARVTHFDRFGASGQTFCAQSDEGAEADNIVGITVVAIGRKLP